MAGPDLITVLVTMSEISRDKNGRCSKEAVQMANKSMITM